MGRTIFDDRKLLSTGIFIFIAYVVLHIVFGRHQLPAYDAYTFMSFAEHYAESWFTTSIPSQAHGLQIASYPPLLFQVMALLSFIPFLNMTHIYILLTSLGATAISIASFYLLDELFEIESKISILVILFIAFSPGLMKSALVYGQMTFLFGMPFGFASATFFYRIIKGEKNQRVPLFLSIVLTAYSHHLSALFTGLIIGIIALVNFKETFTHIYELSIIGAISGLIVLIGLFPMIEEILFGFSQGVIPHGSRHPFQSARVFNNFITSGYGVSIAGILLIMKEKFGTLSIKLITSFFLLMGLGLTTPLPKILFGGFSQVIVYTRFSLIASLFLSGMIGVYITRHTSFGAFKERIEIKHIATLLFIVSSLLTVFWANSIHFDSYTSYGPYNHGQTSTALQYLNNEASTNYLFVTYGHNAPAYEIMRHTEIPSLETGYPPGRRIEEFNSFDRLDHLPMGEFRTVAENADNLSLKYILAFDKNLDPVLNNSEWSKKKLENNVTVWTNNEVPQYNQEKGKERYLFSTIPVLTLVLSIILLYSKKIREKLEKILALKLDNTLFPIISQTSRRKNPQLPVRPN